MSAGIAYSNTQAITLTNVGSSGQVMTSNGAGSAPSFQAAPAGGVTTVSGDSGSVTGATISLLAKTGSANCGATIKFSAASATELDLIVSDGAQSTIMGSTAGNGTFSGSNNSGFGSSTLTALTNGSYNCAFGFGTLNAVTSGSGNCGLGNGALVNLVTGSNNVAIGPFNGATLAGGSYTGSESSNIVISNTGVAAESNVIRIGTQGNGAGQQNTCYVAGITGVTTSNSNFVTINTSTGQLGAVASNGPAVKFISNLSATVSDVTGDGTQYTIICDNAVINVGSAYNAGTGIFTAPTTGAYAFAFDVFLTDLGALHSDFVTYFPISGGSSDRILSVNPYVMSSSTGLYGCSQFAVKQMTAGQTVKVLIAVSGSTKTVDVVGDGTDPFTYFSGWSLF